MPPARARAGIDEIEAQLTPTGDGPRAMIVGFDGSTTSEHALYYALGIARRRGSTLVVVYVATSLVATGPFGVTAVGGETETAAALRARVEELAVEYGVDATFVATLGEPAAALARIAAERKADAVVVGASTAPMHRFFGSTAARVIRHCACPVTVVP